jgi:hypothetical protein
MADIKSAREIAMEKIAQLGEPTEEERRQWRYAPEGEKLAARYLKNGIDLVSELNKFDKAAAGVVGRSASTILIKNINIPKNDIDKKNNKLAMDGIKAIKNDKTRVEAALNQIRHVFNHYVEQGEQQRKQAYAALKADFQAKLEQALRQQMGGNISGLRIDVEKQPQFQEEWRKLKTQLDSQYFTLLDEYKQELGSLN